MCFKVFGNFKVLDGPNQITGTIAESGRLKGLFNCGSYSCTAVIKGHCPTDKMCEGILKGYEGPCDNSSTPLAFTIRKTSI